MLYRHSILYTLYSILETLCSILYVARSQFPAVKELSAALFDVFRSAFLQNTYVL